MLRIRCSRKEKELIRKVVDIQLDNLEKLINNNCSVDLTLFCIQEELTLEELIQVAQKNQEVFQRVKDDPNTLLYLDDDNLSIFRHILSNLKKSIKGYKKTKSRIWKRLFQYEKFQIFYNPN